MSNRLTDLAHQLLSEAIKPGDLVIDATMGNGHDTLFIAERCGPGGHVHAFDIQQQALENTTTRLEEIGLTDRVALVCANHAEMLKYIPDRFKGNVAAITFNLGYLPGGDKSLTTTAETTIAALDQSLTLLKTGGIISIMVYVGHPGGEMEENGILGWLDHLTDDFHWQHRNPDCGESSPRLYTVIRQSA